MNNITAMMAHADWTVSNEAFCHQSIAGQPLLMCTHANVVYMQHMQRV